MQRFEKVIDGIFKYLDREIFSKMNDWQELVARIAVSRVVGNSEQLKNSLMNNSILRTFAIIDSDGNVDVDGLIKDIKAQLEAKGRLEITLPIFGKMAFQPADADILYHYIMEG